MAGAPITRTPESPPNPTGNDMAPTRVQSPVPTLDQRANLYLKAIHGDREFTEAERADARKFLLAVMAAEMEGSHDEN